MRYRVLPYRQGSRSAKALADALGGKVLKLEGSKFKPKNGDRIINWGSTEPYVDSDGDDWAATISCWVYNDPVEMPNVTNKLKFFQRMKEKCPDIVPEFWTNKDDIEDGKFPVVCRTVLSGHSGAGIVISDCRDDVVDCNLIVKYEKKKDEYRVHCGMVPYTQTSLDVLGDPDEADNINGSEAVVIAVQRKARRPDFENPNWQVRNHDNGFIYVRNNINPPASVIANALTAFKVTGLDFGAVDVIWNNEKGKAYVLEINTAPGLEGQTIDDYAKYFQGIAPS